MRVPGSWSYYVSATAARVGDEMVAVAVVLLVLDRTGSPQLAGAVVAAYLVPTVLSGPLLGAWLDRTRYRRAALAANQGLLALVMVALLMTVGHAPHWTALALAALVGVTIPMTSGGFTSLLPRFVPEDLLGRAYALEGMSFNAAAILGPAAAATLAATVSTDAAVAAIVVAAVISLGTLPGVTAGTPPGTTASTPPGTTASTPPDVTTSTPPSATTSTPPSATTGTPPGIRTAADGPVPAAGHRPGLLAAMRTGVAHLARTPQLRGPTVATSVAFTGTGMLAVALPLRAQELTGQPAPAGYVWMAIEAGAIVAALAWGRWHGRWRPERVVLLCLIGSGLAILTWPLATGFPMLLGLALLAGLASGAGLPALFATRQRYTPPGLLGQISTTGASLKLGAFAAGAALAGQLVPALGANPTLLLVGVIQLVAAGVGGFAGRSRRPQIRGAVGWVGSQRP